MVKPSTSANIVATGDGAGLMTVRWMQYCDDSYPSMEYQCLSVWTRLFSTLSKVRNS